MNEEQELATKEDVAAINQRLDDITRLLTAMNLKRRLRHRHGADASDLHAAIIQVLNDISAEIEIDLLA